MTPEQVDRASALLKRRKDAKAFVDAMMAREGDVRLYLRGEAAMDVPAPRAEALSWDVLNEIDRELRALGVEVPA